MKIATTRKDTTAKKGTKNVDIEHFIINLLCTTDAPLIEFFGYNGKKREVSVRKTFRNHPLTTPQ